MHGKNNLVSEQDRPVCSLLGIARKSFGSAMSKLLNDNNFQVENEKDKLVPPTFLGSNGKPGFLRLDSTGGESADSKDSSCTMAPQEFPGVKYITETGQRSAANTNKGYRNDRSPTPNRRGRKKNRYHANPSPQGRRTRGALPRNNLLSNTSSYNSKPHHQNMDNSQMGYPFYQFGPRFHGRPPNMPNGMMPLGPLRCPGFNYGWNPNRPFYDHPRYFVPPPPLIPPQHLFYQAYPFMPGNGPRSWSPAPNRRCHKDKPKYQNKRHESKNHKKSNIGNLQETFENMSVSAACDHKKADARAESEFSAKSKTKSSSVANVRSNDTIKKTVQMSEKEEKEGVQKSKVFKTDEVSKDSKEKGSVDPGYDYEAGYESSDEITDGTVKSFDHCNTDIDDVPSAKFNQGEIGQFANSTVESCDSVTNATKVANNASSVYDKYNESCENFVENSTEDNVDSGFYESQLCNNDNDNDSKSPTPNCVGVESMESVGSKKYGANSENSATAGSGGVPHEVKASLSIDIKAKDSILPGELIYAYNVDIVETEDYSAETAENSSPKTIIPRVSHFTFELTELDPEIENEHTCHNSKADSDERSRQCSETVPPPESNGQNICDNNGAKQKKKNRPSAKKRKRMKQKKGINIKMSIGHLSDNSDKPSANDKESDPEEALHFETLSNSPKRSCFQRVSFILGSDDADSDDLDIEFVGSPEHSPPKSCPKLQFNLLTDSEDDDDNSDSDFENDDHCPTWADDLLLDSFCMKDPYSPFSFQLQCTSVPVKKSASSPQLSPPTNAFAFDVTFKRTLDPNRRRVSFAAIDLNKVIEEEDTLADAYQEARKGPWEELARDRHRFERRIADVQDRISFVFESEHRKRVFDRLHVDDS